MSGVSATELEDWCAEVQRSCSPVLAAADAGFHAEPDVTRRDDSATLIWMADPGQYLSRYPSSRVDESYGTQWPDVRDVDLTVTANWTDLLISIEVEGWDLPVVYLRLGNPTRDAHAVASVLRRLLEGA